MTDRNPQPASVPGQPAHVPAGLVTAVVNLVGTGAVQLGAYTLAELTAVDAVVDFLESRPSDEVLAEAVRSLAARQLLVASPDGEQVHVRGDLGIALAFQQRARSVLDARVTGTGQGEPWRILLLPQPEQITLEIRIDALGVHELSLHSTRDALERTAEWLPGGRLPRPAVADRQVDADAVLAAAQRTALVTISRYTSEGSAEKMDASEDLVMAALGETLYLFVRDDSDPNRLVPRHETETVTRELLELLLHPTERPLPG